MLEIKNSLQLKQLEKDLIDMKTVRTSKLDEVKKLDDERISIVRDLKKQEEELKIKKMKHERKGYCLNRATRLTEEANSLNLQILEIEEGIRSFKIKELLSKG